MTNIEAGREGRIRELDGWRGVSILLVVLHHALLYAFPAAGASSTKLEHVVSYAGDFGVRIFFVVSGFVITRLLILEERKFGSISLKGFYTRRLFRIVPVFYCYLLTVSILSWLGWTPVSNGGDLAAGLFLYDVRRLFNLHDWFVGHSWSLAVEEQFYITFPFFWMLSSRRIRTAVLLGTLAIFLAAGVLAEWGLAGNLFSHAAIVGFSCINVGALAAIFEGRVLRLASKPSSAAVFSIFLVLLVHPVSNSKIGESLYCLVVPFGIALVLMHTVARQGWLSSFLKLPAVQWCGLISYSAYLWQELFTGSTNVYGGPVAGRVFHLLLLLLPLIAAGSFYWIERPCTRFGRKLTMRIRAREAMDASRETAAT